MSISNFNYIGLLFCQGLSDLCMCVCVAEQGNCSPVYEGLQVKDTVSIETR